MKEVFTIEKAEGAVKAIVGFEFGPNPGNMYKAQISEEIDLTNVNEDTFTTNIIKNWDVAINGSVDGGNTFDETLVLGINNDKIFNIIGNRWDGTRSAIYIRVTELDANNNVLAVKSSKIADALKKN